MDYTHAEGFFYRMQSLLFRCIITAEAIHLTHMANMLISLADV